MWAPVLDGADAWMHVQKLPETSVLCHAYSNPVLFVQGCRHVTVSEQVCMDSDLGREREGERKRLGDHGIYFGTTLVTTELY